MEMQTTYDLSIDGIVKSSSDTRSNISIYSNLSFSNQTGAAIFPSLPSRAISVLQDIIYVLDNFGVPTMLTIGFFSNIILAITVRNSELKKISTCCYFFSMGIVDTLFLIAMSIPWISVRIFDIYNTQGFCQLVYYLNLLTTFLSSWFVVMLLLERVLVSYRPDTAAKYCNAFITKCYVTIVSILSIVSHLYLTWTSGVYSFGSFRMCTVIPENARNIMILRKVDVVFSFVIPITSCILLMLALTVFLCANQFPCKDGSWFVETKRLKFEVRLNTQRAKACSGAPTKSRDGAVTQVQKLKLQKFKKSKRLTVVSLVISVVYVTLFIPHNIIKSRITFMDSPYHVTQYDSLFLKLFEELFKINFAYKGVIYFTALPEFRKNLIQLLMLCFKKGRVSKPDKINGATIV